MGQNLWVFPAELAMVMAHEIAHVAARHGGEQMSKIELANWTLIALDGAGGWGGLVIKQVVDLALPLGFIKFSRSAEKEADMLGAVRVGRRVRLAGTDRVLRETSGTEAYAPGLHLEGIQHPPGEQRPRQEVAPVDRALS
jgi:Zn-dependent protease with chaperone function